MSKAFDLMKLGVGGVVVAGAVLAGSLVSNGLVKNGGATQKTSSSEPAKSSVEPIPAFDPITDEIREAAAQSDYTFDPLSVVIPEQEKWDYENDETLPTVPYTKTREGHNLVYYFEGAYSEGWQGDYSPTYCYLYLWDDGYFGGVSGKENVRGFWYNSSLDAPGDDPATPENEEIDCLNMVSNLAHYESISGIKKDGFYTHQAYMYLDMGKVWNQGTNARSIIMNGYPYYPEVAMYIDTQEHDVEPAATLNENMDISFWTPSRVLKNLSYTAVFIQTDVTWSIAKNVVPVLDEEGNQELDEEGNPKTQEVDAGTVTVAYVDGNKSRGIASITAKFTRAGEQYIVAKWNGLEASVKVMVTDPNAPATPEAPEGSAE